MILNPENNETNAGEESTDERQPYAPPIIRSGKAFETVLLSSGCTPNFNLAFGCSVPVESC
jgi:hypothetical protein